MSILSTYLILAWFMLYTMNSLCPMYEPEPVGTGFPFGTIMLLSLTYDDSGGALEPWHFVEFFLFCSINSFALYADWSKMFGLPIAPWINIKMYLNQQNQSRIRTIWSAVMNTFLSHVCQINALTKQVPRHRGFRRSDSETLRQNTHKVGQSGSVPQQHIVTNFFIIHFLLIRPHHFEYIPDLNLTERSFGVIEILD